jgi:hypothetical protein
MNRTTCRSRVLLSSLLIVGLPTLFWLSLFEAVTHGLSIGIPNVTRLAVVGTLLSLLIIVWGVINEQPSSTLEHETAQRRASQR